MEEMKGGGGGVQGGQVQYIMVLFWVVKETKCSETGCP